MTLLVIIILFSMVFADPMIRSRIIGGQLVDIEDFPYVVSILFSGTFCGGSVLSKNYALTSAICCYLNVENYTVRYGSKDSWNGGTLIKVKEIIKHSKFDEATRDYDIAVLKVETPFLFSDKCQPIRLAKMNQVIKDGSLLQIVGAGYPGRLGDYENELHAADLPYVNHKTCAYKYTITTLKLTPRMICAGYSLGIMGPCYGDFGNALTMDGVQVGIASWARYCADELPAVYTNIASVRDWIQEKTGI